MLCKYLFLPLKVHHLADPAESQHIHVSTKVNDDTGLKKVQQIPVVFWCSNYSSGEWEESGILETIGISHHRPDKHMVGPRLPDEKQKTNPAGGDRNIQRRGTQSQLLNSRSIWRAT